ncbi:MAG: helix-turn-helix domain-containing protein [Rhodoglobus sp.]
MSKSTPRKPQPQVPVWVSIRDASEALHVSTRTIRNWISAGHIGAERVGPRLIRIPASELERIGRPIAAA